jgi:hypothetical protein
VITYCTGCATPLGTTDSSCPTCGAAATPQRGPTAATTGRKLILGPTTASTATGTGASAAPSPTTAMPRGGPVRPPRRFPASAAVPSASRSGGPAAVGTITGSVTCDRITATGTGQRLLAGVAGVLAAVALVTLVVVGGIQLTVSVLVPLLPALLIIGFLLLIIRVLLFGFRRRHRARRGGSGHLAASAAKGLARIVVASIRAGSSLEREQSTEVRRFRVTEVSGRQVDCELVGELAGAQLQQGDVVDVFGRTTRRGTVRVRAVIVTSNQARITARPQFGFVLARIANVAAVALSAMCVLAVAYLLVNR